ncbi:hypothetical protein [Halorubrum aethiopicum]|uniref:hypothetical protein n=1 Tax=Halorubrum aethiopicum TaxID=1758255 RepID=UPI00082D1632|nr:hypothetical protein [Halorubrum aethiopicum]
MGDRREERCVPEGRRTALPRRNGHRPERLSALRTRPWITKRRVLLALFAGLLALFGYGLLFEF